MGFYLLENKKQYQKTDLPNPRKAYRALLHKDSEFEAHELSS